MPLKIPASLRKHCDRATVGALAVQADEDALVVRQEVAVAVCDATKTTVLELIDLHNEVTAPAPKWYEFWRK